MRLCCSVKKTRGWCGAHHEKVIDLHTYLHMRFICSCLRIERVHGEYASVLLASTLDRFRGIEMRNAVTQSKTGGVSPTPSNPTIAAVLLTDRVCASTCIPICLFHGNRSRYK